MLKNKILGDFICELYAVDSLNDRFLIFEKYIYLLGFDAAIYSIIPKKPLELVQGIQPSISFSQSYPIDFLDHYINENLEENDFTIRKIKESSFLPMDWREQQLTSTLTENESNLISLARDGYNIKNAISIPTMNNEIAGAGTSIISFEKNSTFDLLKKENLSTLIHLTKVFHDINFSDPAFYSNSILPFLANLTQKEITILKYLASGKHLKNISYSIDITYKGAANLIDKIRDKFGGIRRDQLMYLLGLLNILEEY